MNHYSYNNKDLNKDLNNKEMKLNINENINDISFSSISSLTSPKFKLLDTSTSTISYNENEELNTSCNVQTIIEECPEIPIVPLTTLELEILQNFKNDENKYPINVNYLTTVQSEINLSMRSILCDWLVEVSEEYNLTPQTFNLTIKY